MKEIIMNPIGILESNFENKNIFANPVAHEISGLPLASGGIAAIKIRELFMNQQVSAEALKPRNEKSTNSVHSLGIWILDKLTLVTRPSPYAAERALAQAISRKHEEQMRLKALELSLGIRAENPKGQWQ